MNLLDILSPKAIKVPLKSNDKEGAINELIDQLEDLDLLSDANQARQVVWEREQQRTTGIGEGLAIPHGKCKCCKDLVMAVGKPAEPIDYGAVDNKPVKLIVLLTSPPDKTADHIQALGKVSRMMSDTSTRKAAYNAESAEQMYELFKKFSS